jgi:WD40 repeat protein
LELKGHTGTVFGIAYSRDGLRIASASFDGTARVWNSDGSGQPLVFRHSGTSVEGIASVFGVAFSPDGRRLATTAADKKVRVWNSDGTGEPVVLVGHTAFVGAVAFSPDGRSIVTGSADNTVRVWRDLEPVTASDPRLWTSTSYCLSVALRKQMLGVSDEVAGVLHQRCLERVAAAWRWGEKK